MTGFEAALSVARAFDDDAFLCDFGGVTSVNLPNLGRVLPLGDVALSALEAAFREEDQRLMAPRGVPSTSAGRDLVSKLRHDTDELTITQEALIPVVEAIERQAADDLLRRVRHRAYGYPWTAELSAARANAGLHHHDVDGVALWFEGTGGKPVGGPADG